jgi:hypothetical protein
MQWRFSRQVCYGLKRETSIKQDETLTQDAVANLGEKMFITVEYKTQSGDVATLAEGEGFLPIPNVGDEFSYKDGPFTVKARSFAYYDDDNGDLSVTVTLSV